MQEFPQNTAGSKMTRAVPCAGSGETIKDIEKMLAEKANTFETIDYIYVTDKENVLSGVISIKEIFGNKDAKVEDVMKKELVVVNPDTDQERVVYLALSHGIKALPVVDDEKHLLGVVPYDTILQIFNQEVHEDIFRFGGIFHKVGREFETIQSPVSAMIKSRLPWLIIGVLGGSIAVSVVNSFENILSRFLILAAFIPILAYISDAVGTQSETLIVRSIALDPKLSVKSYLLRELKVATILGLICGILLSIVAIVGWRIPLLGVIVGFSMFLSILAAVFISTFLPLLFRRINLDPAVATGPFATMLSDIVSLAIYFSTATLIMEYAGLL